MTYYFAMYTLFWSSRLHIYYSLAQLTQLEILNIHSNPLNTVPEVLSSLTSLKELNMWKCELDTLPERFVCHSYLLFQTFT